MIWRKPTSLILADVQEQTRKTKLDMFLTVTGKLLDIWHYRVDPSLDSAVALRADVCSAGKCLFGSLQCLGYTAGLMGLNRVRLLGIHTLGLRFHLAIKMNTSHGP